MTRNFFTAIIFVIISLLLVSCSKPEEIVKANVLGSNVKANINNSDVWIPGWKISSELTIPRAGAAVVTYKNTIYMIGGVDGVNFLSSIESATIKKDGSLSSWKVVSNLPKPRGFMSAVIHDDRLYVVGGGNGKYGKNLLNTIVSADFLGNGNIGRWREEKERLLLPRRCSKLIKSGNQLLALGGFGGTLLDSVEVAIFTPDGSLSAWQMQDETLTMPRYVNSVTKLQGKAFVLGGHHPRKGVGLTEVEYAVLGQRPLKWRRAKDMNVARYAFSSFAYENNLFVAGGISGSEYLNSIEVTKVEVKKVEVTKVEVKKVEVTKADPVKLLQEEVTLSWQPSIKLPLAMANFTTIVVNKRVFLMGGSSNEVYLKSAWGAGFNKDGQLGYWGSQKELDALNTQKAKKKEIKHLVNAGTVQRSIHTEGYTYLLVREKGEERWLAAPKMEIKNNTRIQYSEGVYMSNFYSKTLSRNFKSIIFVGTVRMLGPDNGLEIK